MPVWLITDSSPLARCLVANRSKSFLLVFCKSFLRVAVNFSPLIDFVPEVAFLSDVWTHFCRKVYFFYSLLLINIRKFLYRYQPSGICRWFCLCICNINCSFHIFFVHPFGSSFLFILFLGFRATYFQKGFSQEVIVSRNTYWVLIVICSYFIFFFYYAFIRSYFRIYWFPD